MQIHFFFEKYKEKRINTSICTSINCCNIFMCVNMDVNLRIFPRFCLYI